MNNNTSILDRLKNKTTQTPSDSLTKTIDAVVASTNELADYKGSVFTFEGYGESHAEYHSLMNAVSNMESALDKALQEYSIDYGVSYSPEQIDAAKAAMVGYYDINNVIQSTSNAPVIGSSNAQVVQPGVFGSGEPNVGRLDQASKYVVEAFNNNENRDTLKTQISYNLRASRQNEFGEKFFPTLIVPPNSAGLTITIDLISVIEDVKRSLDGTFDFMWNQKSLVNALVDPTILNNDTTRIYPIYDKKRPNSIEYFVKDTDVAPRTIVLENGEAVTTAPLAIGKEFDLLALGSADYLVGQNRLDFTDQLDTNVQLQNVYVKLKDKTIVISNLDVNPESTFVYSVTGNSRAMRLDFDNRWVRIDSNIKTPDGTEAFAGTPVGDGSVVVHLHLALTGKTNLNTAVTSVNANGVKVAAVYEASTREQLNLEKDAKAKEAVKLFEDAVVIGYDLKSRRINTNRRERGQIIQLQRERIVYTMPTLAPITVVTEIGDKTVDENACLDTLVTATYIRCSNAAVATLLNAEQHLAAHIANDDFNPSLLYKSQSLGAARFFVTPHHKHIDLDVAKELNTLRSSERIVDVQGVLVNTIREMVYDGYLKSNYKSVADVLQGENANKKPLVIVGTDPYIAAYLQVAGDVRTLGDEFTIDVVSTPDLRMRGKIIMVFGKANPSASDVANPLHYGNCLYRSEWVSSLDLMRNGGYAHEITVQPSFMHVVHSPVMMSINVNNLPAAVTEMSPVFTQAA